MEFDVQVAHCVGEVGREAWDALSGGRPFASYRWYCFGEAVLTDNLPLYITLTLQGEPVARGTFWLRRREQFPFPSRVTRGLLDLIIRCWPLLMCRTPLAEVSGLILPDGGTLRDSALATIVQAALEEARRYRVSFLAYVYLEGHQAGQDAWPESHLPVPMAEPRTWLCVAEPDFEGYLGHLTKSARKDYRRHRNRAAGLGIEVRRYRLTQPLAEEDLDRAMGLIHRVEDHHNLACHPWARAMLAHAGEVGGTWLRADLEGRLVGCGLVIRDGKTAMMTLLGRDYNVEYAYFSLFYAAIRCAIEEGAKVLYGGTGNYGFKRRLGFQVAPEHCTVFAGGSALLQRLGRRIARAQEGDG